MQRCLRCSVTTIPNTPARVPPRSRRQVENAVRCLRGAAAGGVRQVSYNCGALDGYLWALGLRGRPPAMGPPVTVRECPSGARIASEEQAARLQSGMEGLCSRIGDYACGVRDALAWVRGTSDARP